ncbi:Vacuolar protein sorting-associated protein 11 [Entomophthora muscae]|uniref:Vacuolar protein sorting-associated protein 11 n=1 Tax=Entomophthora muscae TaxID=34485 RepID=A0ACC2UJG2_9FUNG|nr:Vacuolar protein sorting-associated protein 11 [Entomophthora muscae]
MNLTGRNFGKQQPYCLKNFKINGTTSRITSFAISESLSHTAIGLEDGQVIIIKGNIARDRFTKQKVIHSCSEPIAGLGFSDFHHTQPGLTTALSGSNQPISYFGETPFISKLDSDSPLHLFIATTRQILVCSLTGKEEKTVLDEQGCAVGCSSMIDTEFHRGMSLARDDAFYFYGPDGRGPCLAYEGIKCSIQWFGAQLVVTSPYIVNTSNPLTLSQIPQEDRLLPTQMEVYDVGQKLIGFSKKFHSGVHYVVWAFMGFFVLCQDGTLFRVEERDTRSKLEVLLSQDLFHLAITIATQSRRTLNLPDTSVHAELTTANAVAAASGAMDNIITDEELADIYRKYGDFLYSKGDYDSAMNQYIFTIGKLEPSYVIRKFLDAQRLRSLTTYLQELHSEGQGLANPDHTTLLLNCYTKLKDEARLEAFIKASPEKELQFDLETAIRVLRQAGFYELALFLARRYRNHDWYMQIQVENRKAIADALSYLQALPVADISHYMNRYGRAFVRDCPEQTIQLLLDTCTARTKPQCSPLDFSNVFVDRQDSLVTFLEQFCAHKLSKDFTWDPNAKRRSDLFAPPKLVVKPVRNGPSNGQHEVKDMALIWNTLLDLYLTWYIREKDRQEELEHKIMTILTDPEIHYDINHAIVLCKLSGLDQAIVFLYEKLAMYVDILSHWIAQDNVEKILETLRKYGPREPALYTLTLEYFASSPVSLLNHPMEFRQVLDYIDDQSLLPPVQVIQALSRNSVATIGNLKQFVKKSIQLDEEKIMQDAKLIQSYRHETEKKRKEVKELETSARVFQHTKCSSCSRPLDLPALHFLCRHSFHQRCLGQSTERCPLCSRNDQIILDLRKRQETEAYDHAEFLSQLQDAGDDGGFDVIADFLAKNTFQFTSLKE